MAYFLKEGLSISQIHGQPKRKEGRVIMPMYHPAAALYRGDLRPVLMADFAKILKTLQLIGQEQAENSEKKAAAAEEAMAAQQRMLL